MNLVQFTVQKSSVHTQQYSGSQNKRAVCLRNPCFFWGLYQEEFRFTLFLFSELPPYFRPSFVFPTENNSFLTPKNTNDKHTCSLHKHINQYQNHQLGPISPLGPIIEGVICA